MDIPWLDANNPEFPPLENALQDPNGLLAAGADLRPDTLLQAYRRGIFPWFEEGQPILWWSPDPRCVLFPERIHLSRSLKKQLKRADFRVCLDQNFAQVIQACAQPRDYTDGTWITAAMQRAYIDLHRAGVAHSVEVYQDETLVGGLYGLALGRMFFGESMFSTVDNASKVALAHLCGFLQQHSYQLIDCQVDNPHLRSLGAELMPRSEFAHYLTRFATDSSHKHGWHL